MNSAYARRAVITGASGGIGRAVARTLALAGYDVVIAGRDSERLEATAKDVTEAGGTLLATVQESLHREDSESRLESWIVQHATQPIDAFVHCAGGAPFGDMFDISVQEWHRAWAVKVAAPVRLVGLLRSSLVQAEFPSVVLIAGVGGLVAHPDHAVGGAVNAAVIHMVKSLALKLGSDGIRVNAVSPGKTQTERLRGLFDLQGDRAGVSSDTAAARALSQIPLGRIAEAEEIASAISFLCSREASYVSGCNLVVDGGQTRAP